MCAGAVGFFVVFPSQVAMDGKPSISAMASTTDSDVTKLKGTKILVFVEDALLDVLIVSFHSGSKIFQGALLDVTKKNAPYGIEPPAPAVPKSEDAVASTNTEGQEEKTDKLYSVKQRHTYYQVQPGATFFFTPHRSYGRNAKDKSVRMRRLRPRKVLCSHCQEVCNDSTDPNQKKVGVVTRNTHKNPQCSSAKQSDGNHTGNVKTCHTKFERVVTRRKPAKVEHTVTSESVHVSTVSKDQMEVKSEPIQDSSVSDTSSGTVDFLLRANMKNEKMVLRKRKSCDMENSESVQPADKLKKTENTKSENGDPSATVGSNISAALSKQSLAKTSPVIKISFANPQGKDTVLKIPARIQNASDTEEDSNWSLQENSDFSAKKFASAKAAKKALKKAKKEAQKKAYVSVTPTATVLSPSNENGEALTAEREKHHHHKHKVKRKKKHKDGDEVTDKYNLENTDTRNVFNTNGNEGWCLRTSFPGEINGVPADLNRSGSVFEDVKSKCLHQKLSISLKRLNAKAYMRCSPKYSIEEDSVVSDVSDASNVSLCSGSGSDYGDVPDFPKHSSPLRDMDKIKPLMMRISTHNVKKCMLDIGREMTVGDIVWGKIHGFPWWPGKVLALTVSQRDNGATLNQQAHVSWFGSSTSSYMPCNQLTPFLDDFKIRFNKKKRGPYKEAIRQAMNEAQLPSNDMGELGMVAS